MVHGYGRTNEEWESFLTIGTEFLRERTRMRRTTSYTELNTALAARSKYKRFDFGLDRDRAAMGELLGAIALAERASVGALLSSIVLYLNENDAGSGFYALARSEHLLAANATADERLAFWSGQVGLIFDHLSPKRTHQIGKPS